MADYAAEIEVWSDRKTKREEIRNYDIVQDYLANDTYLEGAVKRVSGKLRRSSNSWMVSFTTRKTMNPFPQTKAVPRYQIHFPLTEIELSHCQMPET